MYTYVMSLFHLDLHVHTCICLCMRVYICMYIRIIYTCIHVYVYACVCIFLCIYVYRSVHAGSIDREILRVLRLRLSLNYVQTVILDEADQMLEQRLEAWLLAIVVLVLVAVWAVSAVFRLCIDPRDPAVWYTSPVLDTLLVQE